MPVRTLPLSGIPFGMHDVVGRDAVGGDQQQAVAQVVDLADLAAGDERQVEVGGGGHALKVSKGAARTRAGSTPTLRRLRAPSRTDPRRCPASGSLRRPRQPAEHDVEVAVHAASGAAAPSIGRIAAPSILVAVETSPASTPSRRTPAALRRRHHALDRRHHPVGHARPAGRSARRPPRRTPCCGPACASSARRNARSGASGSSALGERALDRASTSVDEALVAPRGPAPPWSGSGGRTWPCRRPRGARSPRRRRPGRARRTPRAPPTRIRSRLRCASARSGSGVRGRSCRHGTNGSANTVRVRKWTTRSGNTDRSVRKDGPAGPLVLRSSGPSWSACSPTHSTPSLTDLSPTALS